MNIQETRFNLLNTCKDLAEELETILTDVTIGLADLDDANNTRTTELGVRNMFIWIDRLLVGFNTYNPPKAKRILNFTLVLLDICN